MPYKIQRSPAFNAWLDGLTDMRAQDAIVDRIVRVEAGLLGDRRSVGERVSELRIDVGLGYRLYYTMRGRILVQFLCGGSKKSQKADIRRAEEMVKAMGKQTKAAHGGRVRERQADYASGAGEEEFTFTEADLKLAPFDAADYLQRKSSQIHLLRNAFASGHPRYIANALGAVARARGLSRLERQTGIKRQTLNKSLSVKGNPTLETMMTVLGALGLRLEIAEGRAENPDSGPHDRG